MTNLASRDGSQLPTCGSTMRAYKLLLGAVLASAITGAVLTLAQGTRVVQPMARAEPQSAVEGVLRSLRGTTGWLNSEALTPAGLRGKVVLVQFWTYSCINWIRTVPYIRAVAEKYKNKGLVVVGVHTPEFAFETKVENIRRAAMAMRILDPIAIDSDYAIWRALERLQVWMSDEGSFLLYAAREASTGSLTGQGRSRSIGQRNVGSWPEIYSVDEA
jgi:thiol-disulfide isomerase/thioredoxin